MSMTKQNLPEEAYPQANEYFTEDDLAYFEAMEKDREAFKEYIMQEFDEVVAQLKI